MHPNFLKFCFTPYRRGLLRAVMTGAQPVWSLTSAWASPSTTFRQRWTDKKTECQIWTPIWIILHFSGTVLPVAVRLQRVGGVLRWWQNACPIHFPQRCGGHVDRHPTVGHQSAEIFEQKCPYKKTIIMSLKTRNQGGNVRDSGIEIPA